MEPQPAYESDTITRTIDAYIGAIYLARPVCIGNLELTGLDVTMSWYSHQALRNDGNFIRVYVREGPTSVFPKNFTNLSDFSLDINIAYLTAVQGLQHTNVDVCEVPGSVSYKPRSRVKIQIRRGEYVWFDFSD